MSHPSKTAFAQLLRDRRPSFVGGEFTLGESAAIRAYESLIDEQTRRHYDQKRLAVVVHDVVDNPRIRKDDPRRLITRLRYMLASLLLPWLHEHFGNMAALARVYESELKPLLK